MSDDKLNVVKKFSEFWSVSGHQRYTQTKHKLAQLMTKLTDGLQEGDPVSVDSWARYLLLLTYQDDAEFARSLEVPVHDLVALINKLIRLRNDRNAPLKRIHEHVAKPGQTYAEGLSSKNRDLLIAYLQQPAYYAAKTLYVRLGRKLPLEDCFQVAACVISQPFALLKPFKFDRDNTITTFLNDKLPDKLRDEVTDQSIREKTHKQSKSAQLKQGPRNRKKILELAGYSNGRLERYNLLWDCYRETHDPHQEGRKPLSDPSPEQWQQIAECFNQRLEYLSEATDKARIDGATAERMINDCWKAVQDWSNVREPLSLDAPLKSSDPDAGDLQDSIQDSQNLTPMDYMLYLEQREDEEKIPSTIAQAFSQLSDIEQAVLVLWKGLGFGQVYVVELLGKPKGFTANSDVSRVNNALSKLLLGSWRKDIHHDDPKKLRELHKQLVKDVADALKANLPQHCQNWLFEALATEHQILVHLHPDSSSSSLRDGLKQKLLDRLHVTKLDAVPDADQRITALIDSWLQAH